MNTSTFKLVTMGILTGLASSVNAATVFDNGDGANSLLSNPDNWDTGLLPSTSGNPGTIGANGQILGDDSAQTYFVTQGANAITLSSFAGVVLDAGEWTMNGGNFTVRGFTLSGGQKFTVNTGGTATLGDNNKDVNIAGSTFLIDGGTVNVGRHLRATGSGSIFTIESGTLSGDITDTTIGAVATQDSVKTFNFYGGTTTAFQLDPTGDNTAFVFGGTEVGSLTVDGFTGSFGSNTALDWLTGTQMSMTITGDSTWAQTLWEADQLLFNGDSSTALGGMAWATALDEISGKYSFNFEGDTLSLSYTAAIPEPSTLGMLLLALPLVQTLRGRRKA